MSERDTFFLALLRPAIVQILRAAGFHGSRPATVDVLVSLAVRHLLFLIQQTQMHAALANRADVPEIADIRLAMADAGVFAGSLTASQEAWQERFRRSALLREARERRRRREERKKKRRVAKAEAKKRALATDEVDMDAGNNAPTSKDGQSSAGTAQSTEPAQSADPSAPAVDLPGPSQRSTASTLPLASSTVKTTPAEEPGSEMDLDSFSDPDSGSDSDSGSVSSSSSSSSAWRARAASRRKRALERARHNFLLDTKDVRDFINWVTGPVNREIMRVSARSDRVRQRDGPVQADSAVADGADPAKLNGDPKPAEPTVSTLPGEDTVVEGTAEEPPSVLQTTTAAPTNIMLDDEDSLDYVAALKKKHAKTADGSRFQGTVLGTSPEARPIFIEGGFARSLSEWHEYIRARNSGATEHNFNERENTPDSSPLSSLEPSPFSGAPQRSEDDSISIDKPIPPPSFVRA